MIKFNNTRISGHINPILIKEHCLNKQILREEELLNLIFMNWIFQFLLRSSK